MIHNIQGVGILFSTIYLQNIFLCFFMEGSEIPNWETTLSHPDENNNHICQNHRFNTIDYLKK